MTFAMCQHEPVIGTRVPFILDSLPSSLPTPSLHASQSSGFGCPASYVGLALVRSFAYGNTHVSMLFPQIIPTSPSPTESKNCSIYLCLFCCLAYRLIVTIFLNSIYMC